MSNAFEQVSLEFGQVLCEPGAALRHVYFPLDCLISLLAAVDNGEVDLEVGLVGKEGLAGMPLALGNPTSPVRELVQGSGSALRMPGNASSRSSRARRACGGWSIAAFSSR